MKVTCEIKDVKHGRFDDLYNYYIHLNYYYYDYKGRKGSFFTVIGIDGKELLKLDVKKFIEKARKVIKKEISERVKSNSEMENIDIKINELKNLTFEFEMEE
jgi:hypothetical protein